MLTRLKINGFKNLKDVDLRFGLFTCIAGANGVGKSNLFDAITFLSNLASMQMVAAATKVRGTNGQASDIRDLFTFDQNNTPLPMEFIVEVIAPKTVTDDFGQEAKTTATYLEYRLVLCLATDQNAKEVIYIHDEYLKKKSKREAKNELGFTASEGFITTFVIDKKHKRNTPFIETIEEAGQRIIKRYGEGEGSGQPQKIPARRTQQTVLSGINSNSHPTALAMRREMQSWQLLQLEPSALRSTDEFASDSKVTAQGHHLPSALTRIGLYADVAATLSQLIPGIQSVEVNHNEILKRRTLQVRMSGETYTASALSDGTLRFLALSIMACDPDAQGLICMEEPENGIHPMRIPQMVDLVRQLSDAPGQDDEPWSDIVELRQVIINTHSPLVVAEVPAEDLLVAESYRLGPSQGVQFKPIKGHWRDTFERNANAYFTKGQAQTYLSGQSSPSKSKSVRAWANGANQQQPLL